MFEKAISGPTRKDLETLTKSGILIPFYLAGGSAAALYLGHRMSFDLDFFSRKTFDNKALISRLKSLGRLSVEKESPDTLWCTFNSTKLSFFAYDYPHINKAAKHKELNLASISDIACMKISALSQRGTKRDFIDLYAICVKGIPLQDILPAFKKKYS